MYILDNIASGGFNRQPHIARIHPNLKLFDVYQGKGIDPNGKSLALGLTFQHPSRTLTDEEINSSIDIIVVSLENQFDAKLRN